MRHKFWTANRLPTLAIGLLTGIGCQSVSEPSFSDLRVTTSVSRTAFRAGDTVLVTVTVKNVGSQPQTSVRDFGVYCDGPLFAVLNPDGSQAGPDQEQYTGCLQILDQPKILAPGEELVFEARWNGSSTYTPGMAHTLLPPGNYRIQATVLAHTDAVLSEPVTVSIE